MRSQALSAQVNEVTVKSETVARSVALLVLVIIIRLKTQRPCQPDNVNSPVASLTDAKFTVEETQSTNKTWARVPCCHERGCGKRWGRTISLLIFFHNFNRRKTAFQTQRLKPVTAVGNSFRICSSRSTNASAAISIRSSKRKTCIRTYLKSSFKQKQLF